MATGDDGDLFTRMREALPDHAREQLDTMMREQLTETVKEHQRMKKVFMALDVLHAEGGGERAGFCQECGNVMPCQTRKFIAPFVAAS